MRDVFTYGSLMFDSVWGVIVKGSYRSEVAALPGYRRLAVLGETYPVVKPGDAGHLVEGILYRRVSQADLRRLDEFEGQYYLRKCLDVHIGGAVEKADVYVLRPRFYRIASTESWDLQAFEREGLALFKARYRGFR